MCRPNRALAAAMMMGMVDLVKPTRLFEPSNLVEISHDESKSSERGLAHQNNSLN